MQLPKQQGLKFLSDLARIWPAFGPQLGAQFGVQTKGQSQ